MLESVIRVVLPGAALAALAACASSVKSSVEGTATGMKTLHAEATEGKTQTQKVIGSLNEVESAKPEEIGPKYEAFKKEVAALDALASKAKGTSQAMRANGAAYFQKWEEQLGTMSNPEIKQRSEERRTQLTALYDDLTKSMDTCRTHYDTMMGGLRDIRSALDLDLSAPGVANLSKPMDETRKASDGVVESLDDVLAKLDKLAGELRAIHTPATTQPPKD